MIKHIFFCSVLTIAWVMTAMPAHANNDDNLHMYTIGCEVTAGECRCDIEMTVTGCIEPGGREGTYRYNFPAIAMDGSQSRSSLVDVLSSLKRTVYCTDSADEASDISAVARENLLFDGDLPITAEPASCSFTLSHTDLVGDPPISRGILPSGAGVGTIEPNSGAAILEPIQLENPLGAGSTNLPQFIGSVIQNALGVLGSISLLVFVIGGFMWLTSAGNAERVKAGTNTMVYAAIGIFVIFGSYAILGAVLSTISGNSGSALDTQIETSSCTAAGEGFGCRPIDSCGLSLSPTQSIDDKRSECQKNPELCRLNLCPGGDEVVCCQQ